MLILPLLGALASFLSGDGATWAAPGARVSISSSCIVAGGGFRCRAYDALGRARLSTSRSHSDAGGGANPGAAICSDVGGKIVLGRDDAGNDGSVVSCASLFRQAKKNAR